jgi:hypothetical protein
VVCSLIPSLQTFWLGVDTLGDSYLGRRCADDGTEFYDLCAVLFLGADRYDCRPSTWIELGLLKGPCL